MDRATIIAVFACLLSCLSLAAAKNMGKHSGHHHLKDATTSSSTEASPVLEEKDMEAHGKEMITIMDLCNATFPTPMEYFIQLNETGQFPESAGRDAKCHLNCIFTQIKLFDENGKINKTIMGKMFAEKDEDVSKIAAFDKCLEEKARSEDVCERSYEIVSCLVKGSMDYYGDGKNSKDTEMSTEAGK